MTNEIIENQCNVSVCEFYVANGWCNEIDARNLEGHLEDAMEQCGERPNCYYKELQTLKQENEKLRELETIAKDMHKSWNEFDVVNENYIESLIKTFRDIKEIAEHSTSLPCSYTCHPETCKDEVTENGNTCMEYGLKRIITKINEVLQ